MNVTQLFEQSKRIPVKESCRLKYAYKINSLKIYLTYSSESQIKCVTKTISTFASTISLKNSF